MKFRRVVVAGTVIVSTALIILLTFKYSLTSDSASQPQPSANNVDTVSGGISSSDLTEAGGTQQGARRPEPSSESALDESDTGLRLGRNLRLEDFRPGRIYEEYIAAADEGDPDAQYLLASTIAQCRHAPRTKEDILSAQAAGLAADVLARMERKLAICLPLYEVVADLDAEYGRWYMAARNARHPLVQVRDRSRPFEEKARLLTWAISEDYPERHMYSEVFLEAARYHRENPARIDAFREEAWSLLYCEASFACNEAAEREHLKQKKYLEHEYDEIQREERQIRGAIQSQEWERLGF